MLSQVERDEEGRTRVASEKEPQFLIECEDVLLLACVNPEQQLQRVNDDESIWLGGESRFKNIKSGFNGRLPQRCEQFPCSRFVCPAVLQVHIQFFGKSRQLCAQSSCYVPDIGFVGWPRCFQIEVDYRPFLDPAPAPGNAVEDVHDNVCQGGRLPDAIRTSESGKLSLSNQPLNDFLALLSVALKESCLARLHARLERSRNRWRGGRCRSLLFGQLDSILAKVSNPNRLRQFLAVLVPHEQWDRATKFGYCILVR